MAVGERLSAVVADDVDDVRDLVAAALEASGRFDVVGRAADGREAVEQAGVHLPDLIVLDLAMPGVGGLEALPALRAASPASRVVVLSGYPRGRLADHLVARGAVGYVEKSMSPRGMVDEVLEVAGVLDTVAQALAAHRTLEADPASSAAARRFMEETLDRWACSDLLDAVNLLVSELVTNAIVHAGSEVDVAVRLTPGAVRIEVGDRSPYLPGVQDVEDDATSGRGLGILDAVASAWGMEPTETGKRIWFELPRPDAVAR